MSLKKYKLPKCNKKTTQLDPIKQESQYYVSEIQLKYKTNFDPENNPRIKVSKDAYQVFSQMWSDNIQFVEEFNILLLNRANYVIGFSNVSKGGIAGTVVDAKIIFSAAVLGKASSIILAHNHPSGGLWPSQADYDITQKLKTGAKALDILILDHLIITSHGYYSFADEGKL